VRSRTVKRERAEEAGAKCIKQAPGTHEQNLILAQMGRFVIEYVAWVGSQLTAATARRSECANPHHGCPRHRSLAFEKSGFRGSRWRKSDLGYFIIQVELLLEIRFFQ
jgi:hypothetical protein